MSDFAPEQANSEILREFYNAAGLYKPEADHDACGVGLIYSSTGPSPKVIEYALGALGNLKHRSTKAADGLTGDGAGIRCQLPRNFRSLIEEDLGASHVQNIIGATPYVAIGQVFLSTDDNKRAKLKAIAEKRVAEYLKDHGYTENQFLWRPVPVDVNYLGPIALAGQPVVEQLVLPHGDINPATEKDLYILRLLIERDWQKAGFNPKSPSDGYFCSLSADSIDYKGMALSENVGLQYPDLKHVIFKLIEWAQFHARFSTNTVSTADKAHPYRYIAHNGEINTLRGNIAQFMSKMKDLIKSIAGKFSDQIVNVIQPGSSDTGTLDMIAEALNRSGMSLPTVMSAMIPSAYGINPVHHQTILKAAQDITVPWDGPVAIAAANEEHIILVRDRAGLRPMRILQTKDDIIVAGSETGMAKVRLEDIKKAIRLGPGEKLVFGLKQRRMLTPAEVEAFAAKELKPIADAVSKRERNFHFQANNPGKQSRKQRIMAKIWRVVDAFRKTLFIEQAHAHYTQEYLDGILDPMLKDGKEATASMGDDSALEVYNQAASPNWFYRFFRQEFAQVTNPPIDSVKGRSVMVSIVNGKQSLDVPIGRIGAPMPSPVLWTSELQGLEKNHKNEFVRVVAAYDPADGEDALEKALARLRAEVAEHVRNGKSQIVISQETNNKKLIPIEMPLAISAAHGHLSGEQILEGVAIYAHTRDLVDPHALAMLVANGANFVVPYLVEKTIAQRVREGKLDERSAKGEITKKGDLEKAYSNYRKALDDGILKIMAKLGIPRIASYVGARNFSLVGIHQSVADSEFEGRDSPIDGLDLKAIQARQETHTHAVKQVVSLGKQNGDYRLSQGTSLRGMKPNGIDDELDEPHLWTPEVVKAIQQAAFHNDPKALEQLLEIQKTQLIGVRNAMGIRFPSAQEAILVDEVAPVEDVRDSYRAPGISLGAISRMAHRDIAMAMNNMRRKSRTGQGPLSNSGEGGEDIIGREFQDAGSAIKQIASGRFGVDALYLASAETIEIKVAQGAKPGEGGQLPAMKVEGLVAKLRHATPGVSLISPPPHHDIYSIEDLTQLINDLKKVNPKARVCVKLVSQPGIGNIAVGVAKAGADEIHISGHSGGTGASPQTSIKGAGCPVEIGVAEVHQALKANGLRDNMTLIADGSVYTAFDIVKLKMLGADIVGLGTACLIALGCVMTKLCHLNNCPAAIATQNPALDPFYKGNSQNVENLFTLLAEQEREILARLGIRDPKDIVGRTDLLEQVNFSNGVSHHRLLARHESEGTQASGSKLKPGERKPPQKSLDEALSLTPEEIIQKLKKGEYVSLEAEINNTHLSTGAHLAGEIVHEFVLNKLTACKNDLPRGADGSLDPDAVAAAIANFQFEMPKEDALSVTFTGYGGQSFGAWLVEGMRFELQGFGNDYVGKGMRGGKIIIHSAAGSMMAAAPHEHEIAGSTILMGATGGRMYIAGTVRERFAVRNSGAVAVVEGVGDNGCEYMTGGAVAVLGKTGHDFATGMSGGVAFIYDEDGTADQRINKTDVEIFTLRDEHIAKKLGYQVNEFEANLREMVQSQLEETGSARAAHILANWDMERDKFRMILPKEVINLSNHRNKYQLQLPQLFRGRPCCVEVPASAPALAA